MKSINLFLSNACKYGVNYNKLLDCINENETLIWNNSSNPKEFENIINVKQIQNILKNQINKSDIVIFAIQMYFKHKDILTFQYDYAKSINKPILVIEPWLVDNDIPTHFTKDNFPIVPCDSKKILIEIQKILKQ
ncbi:TIR domain-containing protein [Fusobacterium sp. PH5-44]|uniref:TIR domain-containing protein n=1 Tax=unclassified Fusobacterium TaxID=2648384 RepID=UPI003D1CD6C0